MNVQTYNPANFGSLSAEDKAAMQNLTIEEVAELAKAYPNTANGKTYIVLKDKNKKDNEQLFAPSTWFNLAELHRLGQKQWVAYGPSKGFKPTAVKTATIQDLTNEEARKELASVSSAETEDLTGLDDEQLKERFLVATGEEAGDKSREDIIAALTPKPIKAARTAPVKAAAKQAAPKKAAVKTAAVKTATKKSK